METARILTERMTLIPVNITAAGGYACEVNVRARIMGHHRARLTRLTAPPIVSEKVQSIYYRIE